MPPVAHLGSLDTTLAGTGIVNSHGAVAGGIFEDGVNLSVDALGRLVTIGGSRDAAGNRAPVAWRYLEDGSPDPCFGGGDGVVVFDAVNGADPPGGQSGVTGGFLDENDRIVAVGCRANGTNIDMALYRLR